VLLKCYEPFGNFVPGDEIEVPDGAIFDGAYFKAVEVKTPEPAPPAAAPEPSKGESD
jgi:hypothetical protein